VHNLKPLVFAAVSCVVVAGSLSAQTGTGTAYWQGVNGASSCYSPGSMGYSCFYTNPYYEAFNVASATQPLYYLPQSATPFGPTYDVFCVDYLDESRTGTYAVNFTNLGTNPLDVGKTTRANSLTQYLESAWLAGKIESGQYAPSSPQAYDIAGAIWQIMTGSKGPTSDSYGSGGISSWVTQATTADLTTVDASSWVVVTDVSTTLGHESTAGEAIGSGGGQEYLVHIVTPEPATLLLMGTGLLAMILAGAVIRRPMA
jgi:hypothetical protein